MRRAYGLQPCIFHSWFYTTFDYLKGMITTPKWIGLLAVAFVAGSFVASPELRAYAANTIGSSDIINETILSEDIKNSQIKAADIATDAVGAAELQGVTKLLFGECTATISSPTPAHATVTESCNINGVDSDDRAIATLNSASAGAAANCFEVSLATPTTNQVGLRLSNDCTSEVTLGNAKIGIIVYDK